jgi:hypothetical protein
MGCAVVDITNGGAGLSTYPEDMVANIGITDCSVTEGAPVLFPNPGSVLEEDGEGTLPPVGTECGGGLY